MKKVLYSLGQVLIYHTIASDDEHVVTAICDVLGMKCKSV